MPIYEYESEDGTVRLPVMRSIADRDKPIMLTLRRIKAPSRLSVVGMAQPETLESRLLNGYRKAELEQGSKFRSQHSIKSIKQALTS